MNSQTLDERSLPETDTSLMPAVLATQFHDDTERNMADFIS